MLVAVYEWRHEYNQFLHGSLHPCTLPWHRGPVRRQLTPAGCLYVEGEFLDIIKDGTSAVLNYLFKKRDCEKKSVNLIN